jgi:hypothetical protein
MRWNQLIFITTSSTRVRSGVSHAWHEATAKAIVEDKNGRRRAASLAGAGVFGYKRDPWPIS